MTAVVIVNAGFAGLVIVRGDRDREGEAAVALLRRILAMLWELTH